MPFAAIWMDLEMIVLCEVGASEVALVVKNPPAIAEDTRDVGGLDPWVRKSPWSRKPQPAPVFFPGKLHGLRSLARATVHGVAKSRTRLRHTHTQVKISHKKKQIPCDVTYMWNLKYDATGLTYKIEADSDTENRAVVAKGEGTGGRMESEFGTGEANYCVRNR